MNHSHANCLISFTTSFTPFKPPSNKTAFLQSHIAQHAANQNAYSKFSFDMPLSNLHKSLMLCVNVIYSCWIVMCIQFPTRIHIFTVIGHNINKIKNVSSSPRHIGQTTSCLPLIILRLASYVSVGSLFKTILQPNNWIFLCKDDFHIIFMSSIMLASTIEPPFRDGKQTCAPDLEFPCKSPQKIERSRTCIVKVRA